jgi:hypothetical protein
MVDRNKPTDPAPLFPPEEQTLPGTPEALKSLRQLEKDMLYVKRAIAKLLRHLGLE